MEIYLIRHTTPFVKQGICYGQTDLELDVSFKQEASEVLKKMPQSVDVVYSSPLKRCSKLAALIDETYLIDPRLIELNFGNWELQAWDEIPSTEIESWYRDFVNTPAFNGESYLELSKRAFSFFEEIISLNYKSIAVVTHSGVIRALLSFYYNIPLEKSFDAFSIPYGEVIQLKV